jgi:hypothetical protein
VDAKVVWFLYACGIPFNVLRSPYWHETVKAIKTPPEPPNTIEYCLLSAKPCLLVRMGRGWRPHGAHMRIFEEKEVTRPHRITKHA